MSESFKMRLVAILTIIILAVTAFMVSSCKTTVDVGVNLPLVEEPQLTVIQEAQEPEERVVDVVEIVVTPKKKDELPVEVLPPVFYPSENVNVNRWDSVEYETKYLKLKHGVKSKQEGM